MAQFHWLPVWTDFEPGLCGPRCPFTPSLGPFMEVLAHLQIIFLGVHRSPFLAQGCIQSWLLLVNSASVLLPTIAFQSQYFKICFPNPAGVFLSSGWDLAHCRVSPDFAHLLCLNLLADLGKRGFPWQLQPRTHISKARHLTFPLEEQWLKVQAGKLNFLGQIHHLLTQELWKVI